MSSHFSRTGYDNQYLRDASVQSTGPGKYKLSNGQWFNKNGCNATNGPRGNRVGDTGEFNCNLKDRTQIESALQNRGIGGCRSCNITISDKNTITNKLGCDNVSYCSNANDPTYSRLAKPIDEYRGLSTFDLQMDFPLIPPTNWTFNGNNNCEPYPKVKESNLRRGCNTRLTAKDSFKARVYKSF